MMRLKLPKQDLPKKIGVWLLGSTPELQEDPKIEELLLAGAKLGFS